MRHSFLPSPEQNVLRRTYHTHVAIVALFLLSVVIMIGIGSLFPAFMNAYREEHNQLEAVQTLKDNKDAAEFSHIQKELQADNAKLTVLSTVATTIRPSVIVARVLDVRGPVLVSSVAITDLSTSTAVIVMQGVAPTRESLVAFKTRLEGLSPGNQIDLPISGFARSKDLPFSLKVLHHLP